MNDLFPSKRQAALRAASLGKAEEKVAAFLASQMFSRNLIRPIEFQAARLAAWFALPPQIRPTSITRNGKGHGVPIGTMRFAIAD